MKNLFFIFFLLLSLHAFSQDINCRVQVLSVSKGVEVNATDKKIFEDLQKAISEFMNTHKWTNDVIQPNERLECNLVINITEKVAADQFKATAQILSSRPVYGTSYNTTLFNFNDENWSFNYVENQPMEFSETNNQNNLTSMLAYYAYIILGIDYDTFSLMGGTPYFQKAQTIVNNSQNMTGDVKGWKAYESTKNRYWYPENALNPSFKPLRESLYLYHRKGLDVMSSNLEEGKTQINDCLPLIQKVYRDKPNSMMMTLFFTAKADELVNIFSKSDPAVKAKVVATLSEVDPGNISKYQKILTN